MNQLLSTTQNPFPLKRIIQIEMKIMKTCLLFKNRHICNCTRAEHYLEKETSSNKNRKNVKSREKAEKNQGKF